jgi:hypothetical protein
MFIPTAKDEASTVEVKTGDIVTHAARSAARYLVIVEPRRFLLARVRKGDNSLAYVGRYGVRKDNRTQLTVIGHETDYAKFTAADVDRQKVYKEQKEAPKRPKTEKARDLKKVPYQTFNLFLSLIYQKREGSITIGEFKAEWDRLELALGSKAHPDWIVENEEANRKRAEY